MSRSVIVAAVRTPFGKLGGGLAKFPATELGAIAIRAALDRSGVDPAEVGYVVMGQVLQAGAGQAPARQAAIGAGIPKEVPADTINKVCASSIRAIELADLMVAAWPARLVVTGGMESMSNAPYLLPKARFGYRLGNGEVLDHMVFDGLTSTFDGDHMVRAGLARRPRARYHPRRTGRLGGTLAGSARRPRRTRAGWRTRSCAVGELERDEGIRRDTTVEKLAALAPVFDPEGTTTAGNAPGVNDGASCVVVCSEEYAEAHGLEVLATIVGQAAVADDFAYLARTPARPERSRSSRPAGPPPTSPASRSTRPSHRSRATRPSMLGVDEAIVNVNGGAVALGHPIGASGGRIVTTLVHELRRSGAASAWQRSAPVEGRATPCWSRSDVGLGVRRSSARRPGHAGFTGAAHAYTCPQTPLQQRIDEAGAVFVGRSTGFTSVPGSGIPQRLYHFEVDQEVKGDLGRAVSVRIPVEPVNGGQVIPGDIAAGLLMSRADGPWFTTRCGITDPGAVLAEVDEPSGNAIKLLIGILILRRGARLLGRGV